MRTLHRALVLLICQMIGKSVDLQSAQQEHGQYLSFPARRQLQARNDQSGQCKNSDIQTCVEQFVDKDKMPEFHTPRPCLDSRGEIIYCANRGALEEDDPKSGEPPESA
jgi:hypothetical protein